MSGRIENDDEACQDCQSTICDYCFDCHFKECDCQCDDSHSCIDCGFQECECADYEEKECSHCDGWGEIWQHVDGTISKHRKCDMDVEVQCPFC